MKLLKNILFRGFFLLLSLFFVFHSSIVLAESQSRTNLLGAQTASTLTGSAADVPAVVGNFIALLLGLLGVIFLLLIVRAGFLWMTAQGDQKAITKAKDILIQSTVGLLILLSAYAISAFIIAKILVGTGGDASML